MHHLIGSQEIGTMLGLTRQRIQQLVNEPGFPPHVAVIGKAKVWETADIEQWAEKTGRSTR